MEWRITFNGRLCTGQKWLSILCKGRVLQQPRETRWGKETCAKFFALGHIGAGQGKIFKKWKYDNISNHWHLPRAFSRSGSRFVHNLPTFLVQQVFVSGIGQRYTGYEDGLRCSACALKSEPWASDT